MRTLLLLAMVLVAPASFAQSAALTAEMSRGLSVVMSSPSGAALAESVLGAQAAGALRNASAADRTAAVARALQGEAYAAIRNRLATVTEANVAAVASDLTTLARNAQAAPAARRVSRNSLAPTTEAAAPAANARLAEFKQVLTEKAGAAEADAVEAAVVGFSQRANVPVEEIVGSKAAECLGAFTTQAAPVNFAGLVKAVDGANTAVAAQENVLNRAMATFREGRAQACRRVRALVDSAANQCRMLGRAIVPATCAI